MRLPNLLSVAFALGFVLSLLPAAEAKGGPPLDSTNDVLWAQYTTDGGCCTLWMGTLETDPAFLGSGRYGYIYDVEGTVTWEIPLEPALAAPVTLDEGGTVDITVYMGSAGANVPVGNVPSVGAGNGVVSTQLMQGSTVIAEGAEKDLQYVHEMVELAWSAAPTTDRLDPADGNLVWTVSFTGTASGLYMGFIAEAGHSRLALPVTSAAPPVGDDVIYAPLDGLELEASFDEDTTGTYVHNVTVDQAGAEFGYDVKVENGTADVRVLDADGVEVFAESFAEDTEGTASHTAAAAGAWSIVVEYTGFRGELGLSILDLPDGPDVVVDGGEDGGSVHVDDGHGNSVDVSGNEDGGGVRIDASGDDKESPALLAPALLAALGALVVLRRRHP